ITVTDDFGTQSNTADDFHPKYVSGDTNGDGKIDPTEVWLFTSQGVVTYLVHAGQYANDGRVTATAPDGTPVGDTDRSYHFGANAKLVVKKAVNAVDPFNPTQYEDADYPAGVVLTIGSTVTWTYLVTNIGDVPIDVTGVTDDGGVPGNVAFLA